MLMPGVAIFSRCVWGWSRVLHVCKCLGIAASGSMWLVTSLLARLYHNKLVTGKLARLIHSWPSVLANMPCTSLHA